MPGAQNLTMKFSKQFISRQFAAFAVAAVTMTAMSSCGSVFDDLDPCPAGIEMRFVYDYNLESANAFPAQVDCLTLHLYDADGNFITTVTETSSALADEDWRMTLDLAPGSYHAVAYGGIECDKASFSHAAVPAGGSHFSSISMQLSDDHIGKRLHDHFHGALDFSIDPDATEYTKVTMKMTKTTNHFRILLHQLNNEPLDGKDFEFFIKDDNAELDHANSPVAGHQITYPAWTTGHTSEPAGSRSNVSVDDSSAELNGHAPQLAFGELSTSRLHLKNSPRLIVRSKETGRDIIDISLNTFLLMSMSEAATWGAQEYLDRCSMWNMTFFLDEDRRWLQTRVIINGWAVRVNDIEG